jgi:hypothetical protein
MVAISMWSEFPPHVRAFLRAANGIGARGIEAVWAEGCFAAGAIAKARPSPWVSKRHERVVVVATHPDDEFAGCAGTLLRHRQVGDEVLVAVVTDGSASRALPVDVSAMAQHRDLESRAAADRMGVRREWIGLREGRWSASEGRDAIHNILQAANPTLIYAPSNIDFHPEHRRVAGALAEILRNPSMKLAVRIYPCQVPLTPLLVNLIHDVSDLETELRGIHDIYGSQRKTLVCTFRSRHYAARFYGAPKLVEGFCSVSPELFVELHRGPPGTFRALGLRAWADPVSLVFGMTERLRWREASKHASDP